MVPSDPRADGVGKTEGHLSVAGWLSRWAVQVTLL